MNILIPMAGAGSRFKEKGYKKHKPVIQVTDRRTGTKIPMVIAATNDLVQLQNKKPQIIYIDRDFHQKDGLEDEIKFFYPDANFITIENLTEGQVSTCLCAKDYINNNEELIIAACDNGMELNNDIFQKTKKNCDAIVFTFRNNSSVEENPEGYGWVKVNDKDEAIGTSVKVAISNNPINDHAIVGTFWFKQGSDFLKASEKMIRENDRVNNEFYVDQAMNHLLDLGLKVKVFEIDKYICWGTPKDYENYEKTMEYWQCFFRNESWVN